MVRFPLDVIAYCRIVLGDVWLRQLELCVSDQKVDGSHHVVGKVVTLFCDPCLYVALDNVYC